MQLDFPRRRQVTGVHPCGLFTVFRKPGGHCHKLLMLLDARHRTFAVVRGGFGISQAATTNFSAVMFDGVGDYAAMEASTSLGKAILAASKKSTGDGRSPSSATLGVIIHV